MEDSQEIIEPHWADDYHHQLHGDIEIHTSLTDAQHKRLVELEATADYGISEVERGSEIAAHGFNVLARALAYIKIEGLYVDFGAWEHYVPERFHLTPRRANQLISAWRKKEVVAKDEPEVGERVLRALPEGDRAIVEETWQEAKRVAATHNHSRVQPQDVREALRTARTPAQIVADQQQDLLNQAWALAKQLDRPHRKQLIAWLQETGGA